MMRAQTYTIEAILAMKDQYCELPYPGFSLLDVCRKKSAAGVQRLSKGANAWGVSKPKSSDDVLRKMLRGTLNKMTPEKYAEVWESLKIDELIEESCLEATIDLIFAKALQEPGYSKMYAKFCHDIAMHEVSKASSSPMSNSSGDGQPPKQGVRSLFRNMMVTRAQQEFNTIEEFDESLPPEELEELLTQQAKRKRANIKFVGQLYMHRVLSSSTMHRIIDKLLGELPNAANSKAKLPKEIDMEVLCELLETIGKSIDMTEDGRSMMDNHFERLAKLLQLVEKKKIPYGAKVRFKIMDTLELRDNDWIQRVERTGGMTPATLKELQERETAKEPTLSKTVRSPNTKTPNRRAGPQFPAFPSAPATSDSNPWSRNASQQNTPAREPSVTPKPNVPKISFDEKVVNTVREWLENPEPLRDWENQFYEYSEVSEENIFDLVSAAAIKDACMSSKTSAREDCCSFLVNGIGVGKVPLLTAVGHVIQKAIEEDIPSDVPLFYPRLVVIIRELCGGDTNLDIYRDVIVSTFFAYDQLKQDDSLDSVGEIQNLWGHLPKEDVDTAVVSTIVASRGAENPANELVVALLSLLVDKEVVGKAVIEEWLESAQAKAASDLAAMVKEAIA